MALGFLTEMGMDNVRRNMPPSLRSQVVDRKRIHSKAYSVVCMIQMVVCLNIKRMPME